MLIHTLFRHNIDILHIQYEYNTYILQLQYIHSTDTIQTIYTQNTYTIRISYMHYTDTIHKQYGYNTDSIQTIQYRFNTDDYIGLYLFELVCICLLSYVLVWIGLYDYLQLILLIQIPWERKASEPATSASYLSSGNVIPVLEVQRIGCVHSRFFFLDCPLTHTFLIPARCMPHEDRR